MGRCILEPLVVQCACQGIYNAFFLEFCLDLGKTGHIAEPRKTADNSSAFNEGNLVHHDRADHTFGHAEALFLRNDRNLPKEHFLFPVGGVKFYIPAQFLFRLTEDIIKGRKVADGVRVIVIPGTQDIYLQCIEEGLMTIFVKAGAVVSTPTCGPCLGGHMGVMAAGERAVSTTNRNFVGRMGHVDSEVYLASPAVAAASAITGKISSPDELGL